MHTRSVLGKLALAVGLVSALVLLAHGVAGAQVSNNEPADQIQPLLTIDTWIAGLGLIVPFITAVLKKFHSPDWQSGLITSVVSGIVAFSVEGLQVGDLTLDRWINATIQCVVVAVLAYYTVLSDPVAYVANATKNLPGIGTGSRLRTVEAQPAVGSFGRVPEGGGAV